VEKVWLKQYPGGVPHDVGHPSYSSLTELFEDSCRRFHGLPALSNLGAVMTYAELDHKSRSFGACVQRRYGMHPGDRMAIMLPNVLQYPVVLFGALRAGLIPVTCNPLYTARELEQQLRDSGANCIVVLENAAHTVQEILGRTPIRTVIVSRIGDLLPPVKRQLANFVVKYGRRLVAPWHIDGAVEFRTVLARGEQLPLEPASRAWDDVALLQYTGGTTGIPKGAMLTHGNVIANLEQISAWFGSDLEEGAETVVTALPLYHVFALTTNLLTFLKWGGHNVLITDPRDIHRLVKDIRALRFTAISGVNTLFKAMLRDPGMRDVDFTALKLAVAGGMAVQREVANEWMRVVGKPLIEGYGLTEASPSVAVNRPDTKEYTGTVGVPLPSTEVMVRDDDGKELATGEIGELCVRGPQVMKGYWNRPDETARVLDAAGWLRTGDMGFIDERGYLKITDRKKDVIVVSGFKVFPNEVEEVVAANPGVREVVAVGAADEHSGEVVKIVVVKEDPGLTAAALIAYCARQLTPYKVPKLVQFREKPLPKSALGKPLRRLIRDEEAKAKLVDRD
jgi:long-chain acyl-CoA synthetase